MPPPYIFFLIGVRGVPVPVEMAGGGGFQGIVGVPGMEQGIITDSPLANMKQVKDPIWLREAEHVGTMTENNISFFIHQPVLTLIAPVHATHTCDKR